MSEKFPQSFQPTQLNAGLSPTRLEVQFFSYIEAYFMVNVSVEMLSIDGHSLLCLITVKETIKTPYPMVDITCT